MELKTQASEAGHWYKIDGTPAYEVIAKGTGLPRPATLRDAKTLNLCPSVSGIIRCAAAPGLDKWKQEQVLLAALTTSRAEGETDEAYMARIMADSKEQMIQARDKGTAIHAVLQQSYETGVQETHEYFPMVKGVHEAIAEKFGTHQWVAEKSFSNFMGYGGKCDLYTPDGIVIDFKTKDFDEQKIKKGLAT